MWVPGADMGRWQGNRGFRLAGYHGVCPPLPLVCRHPLLGCSNRGRATLAAQACGHRRGGPALTPGVHPAGVTLAPASSGL